MVIERKQLQEAIKAEKSQHIPRNYNSNNGNQIKKKIEDKTGIETGQESPIKNFD